MNEKSQTEYNFVISEKMLKVRKIQLDLLSIFIKICIKYNLRYFISYGSLIGVIRHKGYIPWDDDVDILMPRVDYNKFIEVSKNELHEPYFLQTTLSDEHYYMAYASLRNSNTTGILPAFIYSQSNNGIYIDIIPLEGHENSDIVYYIRRMPLKVLSVMCNAYANEINQMLIAKIIRKITRIPLFRFNHKKIHIYIEKKLTKYSWDHYDKVVPTLFNPYSQKKLTNYKIDYEESILMDFENLKVAVPKGYDRILKTIYGEYMKLPPIENRVFKHDVIYEPDIPYKEYCKEKYGINYDD